MVDRRAVAEILQLEELAELDLAVPLIRIGAALHPLDRLGLVLDLDDPVAGDQLLGLGEWPVDHGALAAFETDARTLRARLQPAAVEHDAGLHHLLVELGHRGKHFLRRHLAGFGIFRGLDDHHETHRASPRVLGLWWTLNAPNCWRERRRFLSRFATAAAPWRRSSCGCRDRRSAPPGRNRVTDRCRPARAAWQAPSGQSPAERNTAA